jgi:hypothetical protein
MEWLDKILQGDLVKWVLVAMIVVNAALSAVSGALDVVGKSDKLPAWVKKVAEVLKKVIDIISANVKH